MATAIEIAFPDDLIEFELPIGVDRRLHHLLDKQDDGIELQAEERSEAEGLVTLAELLTLLNSATAGLRKPDGHSQSLRDRVSLRAGNRCEYCGLSQVGQDATFHVDHIVSVASMGFISVRRSSSRIKGLQPGGFRWC